jgi:SNF2 family DNA or RNA helicase
MVSLHTDAVSMRFIHFPLLTLALAYEMSSIVFSFWKTTLDIIASMFDANSLPYYRIHGSLSASKRSKVLTEFEYSTTTRTLLITLGTGAVGYSSSQVTVAKSTFS